MKKVLIFLFIIVPVGLYSQSNLSNDIDTLFEKIRIENDFIINTKNENTANRFSSLLSNKFPIELNSSSFFIWIIKNKVGVVGQNPFLYDNKLQSALGNLSYIDAYSKNKSINSKILSKILESKFNRFSKYDSIDYLSHFLNFKFNEEKIIQEEELTKNPNLFYGYNIIKTKTGEYVFTFLKNGKYNGYSLLMDLNKNIYFVFLYDKKFDDYIYIKYTNGNQYAGVFKNNQISYIRVTDTFGEYKRLSQGEVLLKDGNIFNGEINNGIPKGFGNLNLTKIGKIKEVYFLNGQQKEFVRNNDNQNIQKRSTELEKNDYWESVGKAMGKMLKSQLEMSFNEANGKKVNIQNCIYCNGKGYVKVCPTCNKTGKIICKRCNGYKIDRDGRVCYNCLGKGIETCKNCDGKIYNIKCTHLFF